jgi:SNF2 family DNA or RNA helicase
MIDELAEVETEKKRKPKKAKHDEVRAAWDDADNEDWNPSDDDDDDDDHYLPQSMLKKRKRETPPKTWIFGLEFHRIVLDEAHIIRNSKTGFFQSVMKVPAERKLCLTGTPFMNKPADIHSLLAFLGAEPLNDKNTFAAKVVLPILECKEIGLSRIRSMMGHVALRRTKAGVENTIQLFSKEVVVRTVPWPEGFHKNVHDVFYETARAAFIGLLQGGNKKVFQQFFAFMALVMRVRQSCCHGGLVPSDSLKAAEEIHREFEARGEIELTAEEGEVLLNKLLSVFKRDEGAKDAIGTILRPFALAFTASTQIVLTFISVFLACFFRH